MIKATKKLDLKFDDIDDNDLFDDNKNALFDSRTSKYIGISSL